MSLIDAYELGYRDGYLHATPRGAMRSFDDDAKRALYAMGYREGGEDAERLGDDAAALIA